MKSSSATRRFLPMWIREWVKLYLLDTKNSRVIKNKPILYLKVIVCCSFSEWKMTGKQFSWRTSATLYLWMFRATERRSTTCRGRKFTNYKSVSLPLDLLVFCGLQWPVRSPHLTFADFEWRKDPMSETMNVLPEIFRIVIENVAKPTRMWCVYNKWMENYAFQ